MSLLAGCHADEPVGPRLLNRLVGFLGRLSAGDRLLTDYEWWVIPHINPDGARRNRTWQPEGADVYDLPAYLAGVVRELPGNDIEFGFPKEPEDAEARPENRAALGWWKSAGGPFALHASLHGMGFGAGPWFLIESAWRQRSAGLMAACSEAANKLGYVLHDVERGGEKGFFRIARGFCTRPDSRYMRQHFMSLGDETTARLFRRSSMEAVRALGEDPLTLVSEMPLFITPGVGEELGPPDPEALAWRERLEGWRERLRSVAEGGPRKREREAQAVAVEASTMRLRPMPVADQMRLQWAFICAGLDQVDKEHSRARPMGRAHG